MENSLDESEALQPFRSPPKRRRSTFFERRDSVVPQHSSDHASSDVCEPNTDCNSRHNDELSKYYEKLLAEKNLWKKEVTNRRNIYYDLRKQYQIATKAPSRSRMSYAALTNEDIEFLNIKTNISKLVDSQKKLHNSLEETVQFVKRLNHLEKVTIEICEARINETTKHILENSTVE